jgi:hypothetical protein
MSVCCECCVLSGRGLCVRADHLSRRVLPNVVCRVWSRNFVNEEAPDCVGSQGHRKPNQLFSSESKLQHCSSPFTNFYLIISPFIFALSELLPTKQRACAHVPAIQLGTDRWMSYPPSGHTLWWLVLMQYFWVRDLTLTFRLNNNWI